MYLRVRLNGCIHGMTLKSRTDKVQELRKKVFDKTKISPDRQRLFFMGKQLENNYTLFDYNIQANALIELTERQIVKEDEDKKKKQNEAKEETDKENVDRNGQNTETASVQRESDDENGSNGAQDPPTNNQDASTNVAGPSSTPREGEEVIRLEDIYDGDIKDIQGGPECKKCKDDEKKKCKECGCAECGGKEEPGLQIFCDECEYVYHTYCLDPPLDSIPDGEWYCPHCKNDTDEIVNPGAFLKKSKKKANMPSQKNPTKRDWGRGMATSGRTKSCNKVPSNHFGPIPGVDVGMVWKFRLQVSEEGVHRPPVAGIAGKPAEGAYSIVLAGGYEDDVDNGDEFYYTGAGGRDLSGNKRTSEQSFDQELTKTNLAIAISCDAKLNATKGSEAEDWKKGKPIRVVRSDKLRKHSKFAPEEGNRYDGIYKVVKYWPEKGRSGFLVWRYLFRRDDPNPAPWTEQGQKNIAKNGYTCIYPQGYLEAQAEKAREQAEKAGKGKGKGKRKASPTPPSTPFSLAAKKAKSDAIYEIDPDVLALADEDTQCKKIWDDVKEGKYSTKLEFTNKVEEVFMCPICQSLLTEPVTLGCSHNACLACLKRMVQCDTNECPYCRKNLKEEPLDVNENLKKALIFIFPGYA